ncbi:hypothetical protein NQU47_06040 [Pseudoalteromonas distincta]|uniref:hypothetical protein n=1 Tax=Pseudoalteromonas distincta TaxID=77608 RepID=UPI00234252A2|nr:hypothetical protein [Pseudoalteromonas distincta]MDC3212124.1 hypothetical protein [Pseudoalteromonas distincta]
MKSDLLKYKHYFIAIAALLVGLYITDPLWISYNELTQTKVLNSVRANKLSTLLTQQTQLQQQLEHAKKLSENITPYMFNKTTESDFKLKAQQAVEQVLKQANCNLERVEWQGKVQLTPSLEQWLLTIRFNGAPLCLVTATKAIELLKPTVRFKEYTYNGRSFTGNPTENINADVDLIMWNNTHTSPEQKEQEQP